MSVIGRFVGRLYKALDILKCVSCHGCDWQGPKFLAFEFVTPRDGQPYYWCRRCENRDLMERDGV